jgi:hypothetical protein
MILITTLSVTRFRAEFAFGSRKNCNWTTTGVSVGTGARFHKVGNLAAIVGDRQRNQGTQLLAFTANL